jgi:hypothetical protein
MLLTVEYPCSGLWNAPASAYVPSPLMEDAYDPIEWQLEQVEKLKQLAAAMGWKETSKQYKFELHRIHQQAKGDEACADTEEKEERITWPPFKGWVQGSSGTYRDKDAARVGLLTKLHAGRWINDKGCPNSDAEGGLKATRHVNKVAVGGPYLARLVNLDGKGKKWRVDTPKWITPGEDEEEEDSQPVSKKLKQAAADAEVTEPEEGGTSAEGGVEPEPAVKGGRRPKGKARK